MTQIADSRQTEVLDLFKTESDAGAPLMSRIMEAPEETLRGEELDRLRHVELDLDRFLRSDGNLEVHPIVLGRGGMGVVSVGRQKRLARDVAVKSLAPETVARPDARRRLVLEALLTGALEHPGIVPIYDIDADANGAPLVALKRVEGTPWTRIMTDERAARARGAADLLDWNLRVLVSLCDALDYAHSRGIIHRDIKPANVMVGAFGEVYLLDWGLAVATERTPDRPFPLARDTHTVVGTPAYMPPELLERAAHKQGPATDIYLLGAVLYEVLTGKPPHRGDNIISLCDSVLRGPPPLPATAPASLDRLVTACMAREPSDRPQSCRDVKAALLAFLGSRATDTIAAAALEATTALEALAAQAAANPDDVTKAVRLLTEARFGFRQVREAGADAASARDGQVRALRAAIDVALRAGAPDAARVFLSEFDDPPDEVRARVEQVVAQVRAEQDRLRATARAFDLDIGRRVRLALLLGITTAATATTLWMHANTVAQGHARTHAQGVLFVRPAWAQPWR